MNNHNCLCFLVIAQFFNVNVWGQTKPAPAKESTSYVEIAANYLSNAVYGGRKDSAVISYIRPSIGYHHKSGAYINAELAYLLSAGSENHIDLFSLNGGYDFSIGDKIDAGLYGSKFFYSDASYAVLSELTADAGFYAGLNAGIISFSTGFDMLFSQKADMTANFGISHKFEWKIKEGDFSIAPQALVNAGTQHFYTSYYLNRKFPTGNGKGRGRLQKTGSGNNSNGSGSVQVSYNNQFSVLDYELSVPFKYEQKKWSFYLTPNFAIPVNPVNYSLDQQTPVKESLTNSFFIEMGAALKLFTGAANKNKTIHHHHQAGALPQ